MFVTLRARELSRLQDLSLRWRRLLTFSWIYSFFFIARQSLNDKINFQGMFSYKFLVINSTWVEWKLDTKQNNESEMKQLNKIHGIITSLLDSSCSIVRWCASEMQFTHFFEKSFYLLRFLGSLLLGNTNNILLRFSLPVWISPRFEKERIWYGFCWNLFILRTLKIIFLGTFFNSKCKYHLFQNPLRLKAWARERWMKGCRDDASIKPLASS